MLEDAGFADVIIAEGVDTFGGAMGEEKARAFDVHGHTFIARRR